MANRVAYGVAAYVEDAGRVPEEIGKFVGRFARS